MDTRNESVRGDWQECKPVFLTKYALNKALAHIKRVQEAIILVAYAAWRASVMRLIFMLLVGWTSAHALQVTDDRGTVVTFNQTPQRIVSMLPSLTESICAMGQCGRLVGVDRYSNHPLSLKNLPRLGGGMDPNIEGIVALKPDVVLVAGKSRATEKLESLGLKVVVLETNTHADVKRVLGVLGTLLQVPQAQGAEQVWRNIDSDFSAVAKALPPRAGAARVYFEVGSGPYAAGEASFIGETLSRLGVKNIVPASLGAFPRLNPEYVVRANPDVIMIGNKGIADALAYPGWNTIKAVRDKRVCVFGDDDADVLMRPGPRMAEAARLMAKCLGSYE